MSKQVELISIIIPAFNAEKTIGKSIQSAIDQTYNNLEIIVVDDCSTDNTIKIASELQKSDTRIIINKREKNGGPGAARNSALDIARGKWIAILDADDWYLPNRIEILLNTANNKNADVVFDNLFLIKNASSSSANDNDCQLFLPSEIGIFGKLTLETYLRSFQRSKTFPNLDFLKPFIKKSALLNKNIRYQTNLRIGEDSLLIMELFTAGAKNIFLIDEPLYCYRKHDQSISKNMSANDLVNQYREFESYLVRYVSANQTTP